MSKSIFTKHWKLILSTVLILAVVGSLVMNFWMAPAMFSANKQAADKIVESEMDAQSAIDNYEWFKQQEADIQAARNNANATKAQIEQFHETYDEDPSEWSRTTKQRHADLHNQLLGIQQMHNNLVGDYNARSSMQNRAVFKNKLPYDMEQKFWASDLR